MREAAGTAELRAVSYLRAQSFYSCPPDRSEFSKRSFLRMKADATWAELERRAAGEDAAADGWVAVTTLIAVATSTGGGGGVQDLRADLADGSCTLPARDGASPSVVVGGLDVNVGAKLPAEELIGREPAGGGAALLRAYLSNVCVLPAARRRGLGKALVLDGARRAAAAGVSDLYVHVVADNEPARRLYQAQCGFQVEQEEGEAVARALNRPRRLLLHLPVGGGTAARLGG